MMEDTTEARLLTRCANREFASLAGAIHSRFLRLGWLSSLRLVTRLLVAHGRCGMVDEACLLFDEISSPSSPQHQHQPDATCWNAIISGCIVNQRDEAALQYFKRMRSLHPPDSYTLSSILSSAYCSERNMSSGEQLHAHIVKTGDISLGSSVGNVLITFYAGWGRLAESVLVFRSMPVRNVISWTALISGHARRQGHEEESLGLFAFMMREDGQRPNQFTFASVLGACGSLASLSQGLQFISLALKMAHLGDIHVLNSLVGFYSECGCLKDAKCVFEMITKPDVVSWNSLLKGYSRGGRGSEALRDFQEMLVRGGAEPDSITFLSVLAACSHSGMTSQGLELFQRMEAEFRIEPRTEHISCVVNLLGRAGELSLVKEFVEKLRSEPGPSAWKTLLGACRVHGNGEDLAELAADRLVELEPYDAEAHVVLSHIYAARGRWDLASNMRCSMKEKGVLKERGMSWITVGCKVHCFTAADAGHPEIHEIEIRLMELINNMKD